MKSKIIASLLAVTALSLSAVAYAGAGHKHGEAMGSHDEHASAIGVPGDPAKVTRTINLDMSDTMRFSLDKVAVKRGETIKFVVKNSGKLKHEMVLGSAAELKEHADMMRKMPDMAHADSNMVSVEPGKTGELVWQFTKAGAFDFACLQPGHFEAGMKGKVAVK